MNVILWSWELFWSQLEQKTVKWNVGLLTKEFKIKLASSGQFIKETVIMQYYRYFFFSLICKGLYVSDNIMPLIRKLILQSKYGCYFYQS